MQLYIRLGTEINDAWAQRAASKAFCLPFLEGSFKPAQIPQNPLKSCGLACPDSSPLVQCQAMGLGASESRQGESREIRQPDGILHQK